jgi:hypothetical protein
MLWKNVTRGARLAIIAGIIIAIAAGATIATVYTPASGPQLPVENGNNTSGGKSITVDLNERMSLEAK